ncbi:MAG TPA: gluconate 2-dehydrogenase subunit 3 family protein [Gammaproteobacteria bacterium]|nr:gluconate 2-dehydrogenase subunit 3 family protein [Gammaproteobacteria bacterium]
MKIKHTVGISRREFLARLAMMGALAASYPAAALQKLRTATGRVVNPDRAYKDPWLTLAAVQQQMFPAGDDIPGAGDIRAIVYLRNTLENTAADGEDREFVFNGVEWLNDLAQEQKGKPFIDLDEAQRETLLRKIEQSNAGQNWLSLLLTYLFEALLADPVYGGNPDGIGWQWLQHQPGFPRPPADKTWYRLGKPIHFRRKA